MFGGVTAVGPALYTDHAVTLFQDPKNPGRFLNLNTTDMLLSLHRADLTSSLRLAVFVGKVRWYGIPTSASPRNKSKVWSSADHAVQDIKSGSVLLCGGEQGLALVLVSSQYI
jgi:hypothetical protein